MTEPLNPNPHDGPTPDETFTWTGGDAASGGAQGASDSSNATGSAGASGSTGPAAAGATALLESLREAVDDLAERATPTVRAFSARAAELAASAADKAAPLVRRAGEATSDASGKLAEKSRSWASDLRASMGSSDAPAAGTTGGAPTDVPPPPAHDAGDTPTDGATPG